MEKTAQDYFYAMPDGHMNAIQRPANPSTDRLLRKMIEHANKNGDCILNNGYGIFRPLPLDPVDAAEANIYFHKEMHRARSIQLKRLCMKQTYEGWVRDAIYANHCRATEQHERLHECVPDESI